MPLQIRRGTDADRTSFTPAAGELVWTTDTQELYVGDGVTAGGVQIVSATVPDESVTFAKMQNINTNTVIGRATAGVGDPEEITCTAAGRALIDDADAAAQRTTLGLVAGGAGDIWVEKAGDTMTGTLTSTIGSVTSARSITATGTSTGTSTNIALTSITHTGAPASNSSARLDALSLTQVNNCGTGITSNLWYGFSVIGMQWGANADGAVAQVRGNNCFGALAFATSPATIGTLTSALGVTGVGAGRFGGSTVGNITSAVGVQGQSLLAAGFTVTDAIGMQAMSPGSGNSISNCIGVDIQAQNLGSTTNIGLRVAAASGGSTTAAIQLSGTTGAASGILFATDTNLYRSAANTLKTDDTFEAANVSGTNTGDQLTYAVFTAAQNAPPASAAASAGTRNSTPILEFDDTLDESAIFIGIMPQGAKLASGLKVRIHWAAASATTNAVRWSVSFERMNTTIGADSFDTATAATTTTSGTNGVLAVTEITATAIDGITAGDPFRLRITRVGSDGADTMTGDAQVVSVEIRSAV